MLQFYFLSVFSNLLAGMALTSDYLGERFPSFAPFKELLGRKGIRATVGVVALVVGFLKLLIRSVGSDVPVVGDLLPALAGLAMGVSLLIGMVRERAEGNQAIGGFEKVVMSYRVPLGIAGIVVAVLHFLLPGALFL